MYSCTLAFLCASRFIKAATASFALISQQQSAHPSSHQDSIHEVDRKTNTPYPDSSAETLSQTSYTTKKTISIASTNCYIQKVLQYHTSQAPGYRSKHTSMNSQFSEVRFSSVAFATASSNAFCWARNIVGDKRVCALVSFRFASLSLLTLSSSRVSPYLPASKSPRLFPVAGLCFL